MPRGYQNFELGPSLLKYFQAQLSMKFVLLMNLKLLTIVNSFLLNMAEHENFSAKKIKMLTFSYLLAEKCHAQLS